MMAGRKARWAIAWVGVAALTGAHALAMGEGDPVTLSVRVGAEYTDNRDSLPVEEDNLDINVIPRIDAFLRGERLTLNFFYEPTYRYRTDPSPIQNESELHHDVGLNADFEAAPRVSFFVRERFNVTDDPAIVEEGMTLRRDSSYTMNRAEAGSNLRVGRLGRLTASGRHRIKRYDESPVARESDEDQWGADVRFWQKLGPTLGMSLSGAYEETDYKSARGLQRGFSSLSFGASLEKAVGAALSAAVWGGFKELDYDDSELGKDSAPYVMAQLRVEAHPGLRMFLRGGYMLRDSDAYPYVSQTQTSYGLDAQWDISARWMIEAGGAWRVGEYDADVAPVTATDPSYVRPVGGEEKRLSAWGSAAFRFNETTSLRLRHLYEDVDSDVSPTFTRNATRVELAKKF